MTESASISRECGGNVRQQAVLAVNAFDLPHEPLLHLAPCAGSHPVNHLKRQIDEMIGHPGFTRYHPDGHHSISPCRFMTTHLPGWLPDDRLPALVAAMRASRPDVTLVEMCRMLEAMREPTPQGRASWYPSSVRALLDRAERLGLAPRGASAVSPGSVDQAGTRSVAGS